MRGMLALCVATAWLGAAGGAASAPAKAQALNNADYRTALEGVASAFESGRCEAALVDAPNLVDDRRFTGVRRNDQVALLTAWANCAIGASDWRTVYEAFGQLAPIAIEPDWPWRGRLLLALDFKEAEVAVEAFDAWARVSPDGLSTVELRSIWDLLRQAGDLPGGDDVALAVHETIARIAYAPSDPLVTDEGLRVAHARLLVGRGRGEDAKRRLGEVRDLRTLIELGADASFDEVLTQPRPIDFVGAAEREVERARELVLDHPRRLEARYRHVLALRGAGRDEDALREADRALADAAADPDAFEDAADYLNWIQNDRAYALYALGRADEGRSAMRAAIGSGEGGRPNVSQVINLSMLLSDEGRPEEALATLELMAQASPYGEMWAASVRACATAQTGDDVILADALSYLREHAEENTAALQRGLLCANFLDEAAALYVRRLGETDERGKALIALQSWAADPAPLPHRAELRRRLEEVRGRSDVQAALSAVGRVQEIPFPLSYWGDL